MIKTGKEHLANDDGKNPSEKRQETEQSTGIKREGRTGINTRRSASAERMWTATLRRPPGLHREQSREGRGKSPSEKVITKNMKTTTRTSRSREPGTEQMQEDTEPREQGGGDIPSNLPYGPIIRRSSSAGRRFEDANNIYEKPIGWEEMTRRSGSARKRS